MRIGLILLSFLIFCQTSHAGGVVDDPLLTSFKINQLEWSDLNDDKNLAWDAEFWAGYDLNKLVLKLEGEREDDVTEQAEFQLLWSHAITPYWQTELGWRYDAKPKAKRNWLALGVEGLAPYFVETEMTLFIGEKGNVGLRTEFEKEIMLSQKWVLVPEIEANFFSKRDADTQQGSGLSELEFGLRLQYQFNRHLLPYVGFEWHRAYGSTADFLHDEGEDESGFQWLIGLSTWF